MQHLLSWHDGKTQWQQKNLRPQVTAVCLCLQALDATLLPDLSLQPIDLTACDKLSVAEAPMKQLRAKNREYIRRLKPD